MSPRSFLVPEALQAYVLSHSEPLDEVQQRLVDDTAALGAVGGMQLSPDQGALLGLLVGVGGVRDAIEIGTFTGYSSLCIARAMPQGGRLLCCDVSEEWTSMARAAWAAAGVDDRIELRVAPALETLASLEESPQFDLAFVDADKGGYLAYYEALVPRLRPGGMLLADNTLWSGRVLDPDAADDDTRAIRAFNDRVAADPRTETLLLPLGDGLTICRRR